MAKINSTSSMTGATYVIPSDDDRGGLSNFIDINEHKQVVAIQGLGFVGTVMSLVVHFYSPLSVYYKRKALNPVIVA